MKLAIYETGSGYFLAPVLAYEHMKQGEEAKLINRVSPFYAHRERAEQELKTKQRDYLETEEEGD